MAGWNANDPISHQQEAAAVGTARSNLNNYGGLTQQARGLVLEWAPWTFNSASVVDLVRADEIVMHDGVRVSGWANLQASMSVAGAGGYLGGGNGTARWYRTVALRKSVDGTKAVAFAMSGSYVNETGAGFTTGDDTEQGLRAGSALNIKIAQGFQVATAAPVIHAIRLFLRRPGAPDGRIWLTIETNTGGFPSGTVLGTSRKIRANAIAAGGNSCWVTFVFRPGVTLASGVQYHFVLQGDYTTSATNYIAWRADGSAPTYTGGQGAQFDGTSWAASTADFLFQAFYKDTDIDIATNLPAGYDQYAVLGWNYFSSGSVFYTARQVGDLWNPMDGAPFIGATSASSADVTWHDMGAFAPPIPVEMEIGIASASTIQVYLGGVPADGFIQFTGSGAARNGGGMGQAARIANAGDYSNPTIRFLTDYQQMYSQSGGAVVNLSLVGLRLLGM